MYSTDPVQDASRHMDKVFAEADRLSNAEWELDRSFTAACAKGDANALAPWAPMTRDWLSEGPASANTVPLRYQTLAELMQEATEYSHGPSPVEVLQLVLNVANGQAGAQDQAKRLIERMATAWAKQNVEA